MPLHLPGQWCLRRSALLEAELTAGAVAGGCIALALGAGHRSERGRTFAAAAGLAIVLLLVAVAQASPAFDGYDADVWTYLLIVERLAAGADLNAVEPFRLLPPPSPHIAPLWQAVAWLRPAIDPLVAVRILALVSIPLLSLAAFRFARLVLDGFEARVAAVALFWLAVPSEWSALGLGRTLGLAPVLMAASAAWDLTGRVRGAIAVAAWIGLAFWVHAFMGALAVAAAILAALAGPRSGRRLGLLAAGIVAGVLLGAPTLALPLALSDLAKSSAHTWHPDAIEWAGLRVLHPAVAARLWPLPIAGLALVGLFRRGASPSARRLAALGSILVAMVLFTPLFGLVVERFGAWMSGRFAHLAFVWIAAARGAALLASSTRWATRTLAAVLVVAGGMVGAAAASHDFTDADRNHRFGPAARSEAAGLRPILKGRGYISADLIAYALAAPTLGRPLGVPPGHASPYGDFVREHRRVVRTLGANTRECWASLLALYPDVELLVTPAPGADDERRVWASRVGNDPAEVRALLAEAGALDPVASGPHFVVDRIRNPDPARSSAGAMGEGRRCQ